MNRVVGDQVLCLVIILLPEGLAVKGVVMVDQVKSLDYAKRHAKLINSVPPEFMAEVMAIHEAIFQDD